MDCILRLLFTCTGRTELFVTTVLRQYTDVHWNMSAPLFQNPGATEIAY